MSHAPLTPPANVDDFKATFQRGFKYTDGPNGVMDADISQGIARALPVFNPSLFDKPDGKTAFLLLVAHFVVVGIQAAGGLYPQLPGPAGAAGAPGASADATENTGSGVIGTKTSEKISVAYAGLEDLMKRYPTLAPFRQTDFGAQYALLVAPRLTGRIGLAPGPSYPDVVIPAVPFLA